MNYLLTSFLLTSVLALTSVLHAQDKKVLFLGNSYTYGNNMPQLVQEMAASTGKTLNYDMHAPGGYYLGNHVNDAVSVAKIMEGDWDYVVLQDQSLALAYPSTYMNGMVYAVELDSLISVYNPCARPLFYCTWGRKNGDQYVCTPPECNETTVIVRTYFEMDSTIESHYRVFADSVKGEMAPVGAVWRALRQQHPSIELFQSDDSHATLSGSYAAACCFYTAVFRSDPTDITFNSGVSTTDAAAIRNVVKTVMYDELMDWNVGVYDDLLDPACLTLGITEDAEKLLVYPNPATNFIRVNQPFEKVEVFDANGRRMDVRLTSNGDEIILDTKNLAPGCYLITTELEGKAGRVLFLKE